MVGGGGMTIDWQIIAAIASILGPIAIAITFVVTNKADIKAITNRLVSVEAWLQRLSDSITMIAGQKERLDGHGHRIDRLERQMDDGTRITQSRAQSDHQSPL